MHGGEPSDARDVLADQNLTVELKPLIRLIEYRTRHLQGDAKGSPAVV